MPQYGFSKLSPLEEVSMLENARSEAMREARDESEIKARGERREQRSAHGKIGSMRGRWRSLRDARKKAPKARTRVLCFCQKT